MEELVTAIRRAFAGQRFVSRDVAQKLALRTLDNEDLCPFEQLSSREMQITLMVINCHRVHEISHNLHLSPKTVNSYRYRNFRELKVSAMWTGIARGQAWDDPPSVPLSPTPPLDEEEDPATAPSGPVRAEKLSNEPTDATLANLSG